MASATVTVLTDANFDSEVTNAGKPVVIDFWATWCGPCIRMAPIFEQLSEEYAGAVKFTKVDVDDSPGVAERFGVNSMPTFIVFNGGEKGRKVGGGSKNDLKAFIDSSVKK